MGKFPFTTSVSPQTAVKETLRT